MLGGGRVVFLEEPHLPPKKGGRFFKEKSGGCHPS